MAITDHTTFKGVTHVRRDNFTNNLLHGTIDFFKWGLLGVGGFQNITIRPAVSGVFGGDRFQLRPVSDPNYTDGQVWAGFRNDWVWETGVGYSVEPIRVSGVFIGGTFSTPTGASPHFIDYPRGRIVLDTAIATTSTVTAEFSHRTVGVCKASEPFFRELLFDSYEVQTKQEFLTLGSGNRDQLGDNRLQLPVIGVEVGNNSSWAPYEIGGATQWAMKDVYFHIFADNEEERNDLRDIVEHQIDKTIWLSDRGMRKVASNYPQQLDFKGSPVVSGLMYPDIVAVTGDGGFRWRKVSLGNISAPVVTTVNNWLYRATVRSTVVAVLPHP